MLMIVLFATSCGSTTKLNSEASVIHGSSSVSKQIDSLVVYKQDSVYVYIRERGDTVFVNQYHTKITYRDRVHIDTIRMNDTVRIIEKSTETITVEENRLTGWQWFQIYAGRVLFVIVCLISVYLLFKWKLKF
jgi:hypothetical protein